MIGPFAEASSSLPRVRLPPLPVVVKAVALAVLLTAWVVAPNPIDGALQTDAENFWRLSLDDPYRNRWGQPHSFVYSPAVAQVLHPFTLLPFEVFYRSLLAVNLACLWWLIGPWSAVAIFLPFVSGELTMGMIHLPMAVAVVLSLRHPGAWAMLALTKVTPGATLLWWLARREWRQAALALGTTTFIVLASALVMPGAWRDWFDLLRESSGVTLQVGPLNEWPVTMRLPIAAALVVLAAARNRPAALPVIVCYTLPAIWGGALVMLFAIPRLVRANPSSERVTH